MSDTARRHIRWWLELDTTYNKQDLKWIRAFGSYTAK